MAFLVIGIWATFAVYGVWISSIKRRPLGEGLALGLLLGPLGCLVSVSLRERDIEALAEEQARRQEEVNVRLEEEEQRRLAYEDQAMQMRELSQQRAEAARLRRAEFYLRVYAWFDRTVLKFGWYKALPEVAQPIVVGLLVALPLVVTLVLIFKRR